MENINSVNNATNLSSFSYKAWLQSTQPQQPVTDAQVHEFFHNLLQALSFVIQQAQAAADRSNQFFHENVAGPSGS